MVDCPKWNYILVSHKYVLRISSRRLQAAGAETVMAKGVAQAVFEGYDAVAPEHCRWRILEQECSNPFWKCRRFCNRGLG